MKKLLVTTALVVGIGFGAQASDPNDTLTQITEIVAAHYLEEIENLNASHAQHVESINQNWIDNLNYWSFDGGNGTQVNSISELVYNSIYPQFQNALDNAGAIIADLEVHLSEAYSEIADLNEVANNLDQLTVDLQAESEAVQAWAEYEITVRETQIVELEEEVTATHQKYIDEINAMQHILDDGFQELFGQQWSMEPHVPEWIGEVLIYQLTDIVNSYNAQINEANRAAQEASNRANSNAANVAAWYEEAQRLQAEVDRLQEELDNQ